MTGETKLQEQLAQLVAIQSQSGDEDRAADFVQAHFAAQALEHVHVERVGKSIFARFAPPQAGSDSGPRLFLNSHLDTVPAGEGWEVDPWAAQWENGRLVGLGANDAKASVLSMLTAFCNFARSANQTGSCSGELWLGLTEREETNNAGMTAIIEHIKPKLGLPDAAVTGEPTGLEVVRAQSGLAILEARWKGRSCHAAHVARVEHQSAMRAAVEELAQLEPYTILEGEHPLLGASTLVGTVLQTGDRHNRVPDEALAVFDARLAPPHTASECQAYLRKRLPTADVTIRSERLRPVETATEHPFVQAALAASGKSAPLGSATMSDMALLAGVPAIKCGPGQTARSHTPGEYLEAHELEAGARFYEQLIPLALEALSTARS